MSTFGAGSRCKCSSVKAISAEKRTIWLIFLSGLFIAATRPSRDYGRVAASRRPTRILRQLVQLLVLTVLVLTAYIVH
jgi:hypothetical protein